MQQMNDLQQTQATKVKLVSDARGLAEKFEEANERQDALNDRCVSCGGLELGSFTFVV